MRENTLSSKNITIVQLNDVHGHVKLHNEAFFENEGIVIREVGGYARIKSLIDGFREENPNTIVLDCGDTFHGTFITTQTEGSAIIPLMNEMGLDAATAHWDFAYTPSHLREIANRLNYPILSANTYVYDKKERLFSPYIIKEIEGLRIGIIGMACEHVVQGFPKNFNEGIYMSPEFEELPQIVLEVRDKEKADIIILLSHLGMPTDYELLKTIPDVDICVSGHTHNRLATPIKIGKTLLIQSGCHGSFITKLDLKIVDNKIIDYNHQLLTVEKEILENERIKELIDSIYKPYNKYLLQKVGKTKSLLNRDLSMESTMDNFLLNAIKFVTNNNVCFSHGWRYGTPIVEGDITIEDLYNIVPMNPKIKTVELKGYEILDLLETKINKTYNINPFGQTGGFMQRAIGIKAYVLIENPSGHRIQKLYIDNELMDMNKDYKVSYITEQAIPKYLGKNHETLDITAIDALTLYLKEKGEISQELYDTFVII